MLSFGIDRLLSPDKPTSLTRSRPVSSNAVISGPGGAPLTTDDVSDDGYPSDVEVCCQSPAPPRTRMLSDGDARKAHSDDSLTGSPLTAEPSPKHDTDPGRKPNLSYIALISMAILNSRRRKCLLSEIYQYIMDQFVYYENREDRSWRNSIRHNLSLNECFIKDGRCDNGKGNYWAIHPANIDDFARGDFSRRKARRRVRECEDALRNGALVRNMYTMLYRPYPQYSLAYQTQRDQPYYPPGRAVTFQHRPTTEPGFYPPSPTPASPPSSGMSIPTAMSAADYQSTMDAYFEQLSKIRPFQKS